MVAENNTNRAFSQQLQAQASVSALAFPFLRFYRTWHGNCDIGECNLMNLHNYQLGLPNQNTWLWSFRSAHIMMVCLAFVLLCRVLRHSQPDRLSIMDVCFQSSSRGYMDDLVLQPCEAPSEQRHTIRYTCLPSLAWSFLIHNQPLQLPVMAAYGLASCLLFHISAQYRILLQQLLRIFGQSLDMNLQLDILQQQRLDRKFFFSLSTSISSKMVIVNAR